MYWRPTKYGLALSLLLLVPAGRAQTMISSRTAEDVASGEAAQAAELKLVGGGIAGNYNDPHGNGFPYRIYPPPRIVPGARYPMYVYWEISGTPRLAMPSSQAEYPVYVVTVGCDSTLHPSTDFSARWKELSADGLKAVADLVIAKYGNIDKSRIYTGGFSKAGGAAWQAVLTYPDFFAAIIPSSATIPDLGAAQLLVSRKIAVWMFQGGPGDMVTSSARSAPYIVTAMRAAGGNPRYTQYQNLGHHEAWFSDSLTNPAWNDFTAVRKWLFAQHKP